MTTVLTSFENPLDHWVEFILLEDEGQLEWYLHDKLYGVLESLPPAPENPDDPDE
jgi:hypothetical protein